MAKISEHFTSSFLKTEDFDEGGQILTIDHVEEGTAGKDEKLIVHLTETDQSFPLNKTNALQGAENLGDDTDDWAGQQIRIYRTKTTFEGKMVDCLRIAETLEVPAPKPARGSGSGSGSGSDSGSTKSKPVGKGAKRK